MPTALEDLLSAGTYGVAEGSQEAAVSPGTFINNPDLQLAL
jgi:hypothetical protein